MAGAAAFAPLIGSVAGGLLGGKSAKDANKPQPYNETQTRTPWATGQPYIEDVLRRAQETFNRPAPSVMPSGWGRMLSPEQQAQQPPSSFGGGGGGGGAAGGQDLNWRGRPRAEVQAAKAARQQARTERQQDSGGRAEPIAAQIAAGQAADAARLAGEGGAPPPRQLDQGGMFSAPKQIQQDMYQMLQRGGTPTAQAGNQYVQNMLGGQVQNPLLSRLFERLWAYQPGGAGAPPPTAGPAGGVLRPGPQGG